MNNLYMVHVMTHLVDLR